MRLNQHSLSHRLLLYVPLSCSPSSFLPLCTVQSRTAACIPHSVIFPTVPFDWSAAEEKANGGSRVEAAIHHESPRATLREDGPHLLAQEVKKTNDHCLTRIKTEDGAALVVHSSKEQWRWKTVCIIRNSGRSWQKVRFQVSRHEKQEECANICLVRTYHHCCNVSSSCQD